VGLRNNIFYEQYVVFLLPIKKQRVREQKVRKNKRRQTSSVKCSCDKSSTPSIPFSPSASRRVHIIFSATSTFRSPSTFLSRTSTTTYANNLTYTFLSRIFDTSASKSRVKCSAWEEVMFSKKKESGRNPAVERIKRGLSYQQSDPQFQN